MKRGQKKNADPKVNASTAEEIFPGCSKKSAQSAEKKKTINSERSLGE